MGLRNKCGFFALLFVALSTSLLGLSSDASAWTPAQSPLPVCENIPDYRDALASDGRFNTNEIGYIVFMRDFGGSPFYGQPAIVVDWFATTRDPAGSGLYFHYQSYGEYFLQMAASSVSSYTINPDGSLTDKGWPTGNSVGLSDLSCIFMTKNMAYMEDYIWQSKEDWLAAGRQDMPTPDQQGGGDQPVFDEAVRCEWHDVGCWIGELGTSIVDSFQSLGTLFSGLFGTLFEFLGNLFIPSDHNIFAVAFSNLQTYMTDKLGMLLFPFQFVSQQVGALMTIVDSGDKSEWHCTSVGGNWENATCKGPCIDSVIGDAPLCPLQVGRMESQFPLLWNTGIFFLRLTVFVAMIEMLRRKYMEVTKA